MARSSSSRKSTTTTTTQSVTSKSATRASVRPPAIRGEKRVKQTSATVPVGPPKRRRGTHDGPTDPAAIDRRKEFVGTDQRADGKPGKAAKSRGGGNAGRGAVGLPGRV